MHSERRVRGGMCEGRAGRCLDNSAHPGVLPLGMMPDDIGIDGNRIMRFGWRLLATGLLVATTSGCSSLTGLLYCQQSGIRIVDLRCFPLTSP
ncbi:hypothetical protein [Burkholderia gladioli]|uniref:hypothetical protein n=2 Tax=Burkholderia gladioli TaxID=28095 RepID=UPI0016418155|nr:hypothetical protein [Burkholderia gladioli]